MTDLEAKLMQLIGARHVHTLTHALQIAAERFDEDARTFETIAKQNRSTKPTGPAARRQAETVPLFNPAAADRLADQFNRQAADARELLASIQIGDEGEEG